MSNIVSSLNDIPAVKDYLRRVKAVARSFRTAVVSEKVAGKYEKITSTIHFSENGIVCDPEIAPTAAEAEAINAALKMVQWPQSVRLTAIDHLPPEINGHKKDVFEFFDVNGDFIMLQQRIETKNGKAYVPWSRWSDGQWRRMEPEGKLPLWGLPQLNEHSIVFLHEGAKAAKYIFDILESDAPHPWKEELKSAAHLGWIGGALNFNRTDWSILRKYNLKRVIIVADNDAPGRQVVPKIAQQMNCSTFALQFSQDWPESFDLADSFPKTMFTDDGSYKGNAMSECLEPATWATDEFEIEAEGRGRPKKVHVIREAFAEQWRWIENMDIFVHIEFPNIQLNPARFNSAMSAFSHVQDTAKLFLKHYSGRHSTLTYRPDLPQRMVKNREGESAINLYRPSMIRPIKGDVQLFLDFMDYLLPIKNECEEIKRWCATLMSQPQIRIGYGLLMLSEQTGVGKTTLGSILAEVIGRHNCSFPSEGMIVNTDFNAWLANKRLIVVNEVYSGHSWKAYQKLKTYVTDDVLEVNIKFQSTYSAPNCAHFYVCSNSKNALRLEAKDRRWYVPAVAEERWDRKNYQKLFPWLSSGGYQKIAWWAKNFGDYLLPGDFSPMTEDKKSLIDESRSEAERAIIQLGEIVMGEQQPIAMSLSWVKEYVKDKLREKVYESERKIANVLREVGLGITEQVTMRNQKMRLAFNKAELAHDHEALKNALKHPKDLMQQEF